MHGFCLLNTGITVDNHSDHRGNKDNQRFRQKTDADQRYHNRSPCNAGNGTNQIEYRTNQHIHPVIPRHKDTERDADDRTN